MLFILATGDAGSLTPIFSSYPHLQNADLGVRQRVEISGDKTGGFSATLTLPTNSPKKPLPTVIFTDSSFKFLDSMPEDYGFHMFSSFFANRGYAVIYPDFGGLVTEAIPATLVQERLVDVASWLTKQKISIPGKVCLVGFGYGGQDALLSTAHHPELFSCAVSLNAITDLFSYSSHRKKYRGYSEFKKLVGSDRAILAQQSPINFVKDLQASCDDSS